MKFSIFSLSLSLLLCSTSAISNETKPSQVKKTFNRAGTSNIFSGVNFHYLDKEDRIDIINSFLKRVQSDYSLLPIKEKRIGLNLKKMKAEAIDIENNISSILLLAQDKNNQELREKVSFLQAKQNLEFFDRMAKLVAHGVLQLLTFSTVNVKNDQVTQPFISAIANFILELKTNDVDLIIDLRNNGGGQINYTSQLLSLIAKTGANYPGQTGGYRIVPTIREIFEADMF
jgi:hypothetical protein